MWITDVVPYATILSTWGNNVRDRLVQTFDTLSEANTHVASLPEGAVAFMADTGSLFVKRGGTWRATGPRLVYGANGPDTTLQVGAQFNAVTLAVPPGYRQVHLNWRIYATAQGVGTDYRLVCNLFTDGGSTGIGTAIFNAIGRPAEAVSVSPNTFEMSAGWDIPVAGVALIGTIQNGNPGGSVAGPVTISGNNYYSRLFATCLP